MAKLTTYLDQYIKVGIYLLLLTPLLFWNEFYFPAITPKTLLIFLVSEISFFLFAWFYYLSPLRRPKIEWPAIIFFVYIGILSLATIAGIYPSNSFWGDLERSTNLLIWLHISLVFILLLSVARSEQTWLRISLMSVSVGLIASLIHFFSPLFSDAASRVFNSGSTLGNSSFFGTFLLFQLFFSLILVFRGTQRLRWFGGFSFLLFLLTLFSTDARAVIVSVIGGSILFLSLIQLVQKQYIRKILAALLLLVLVMTFFGTVFFAFKTDSFLNTWIIDHGTGSRFVVWNIAWEAFKERPLLGWGPENFRYAFLEYYDPCFGNKFCGGNILFDKAHNIILDILIESGLFGLFAYLALFCALFWRVWISYKKQVVDIKIAALITAILAAYFVQNLTAFDTAVSLLFFVFLFGFIVTMTSPSSQEFKIQIRSTPFIPVIATLILPISLFFFVIQPARGVLAIKTAATSLNTVERLGAYEKGSFISPFGRDVRRDFLGLQTANLLWGYHPINDATYVQKIKPYFETEIYLVKNALKDTIARSPNDFRAYMYLTKILQAEGRLFYPSSFSEAHTLLAEALTRNPKQKLFYWIRVSLLLEQGNTVEASKAADIAKEIAPGQKRTLWNAFLFGMYVQDQELISTSFENLIHSFPEMKDPAEDLLKQNFEKKQYELLSEFYLE